MAPPAYHERQSRQLCLKHTLNNLLQRPAFTAADLDRLADGMSPPGLGGLASPHRTPLLGNYDVNVLELALQQQGKSLTWLSRGSAQHHQPGEPGQQLQLRPAQDTWLDWLLRDLQQRQQPPPQHGEEQQQRQQTGQQPQPLPAAQPQHPAEGPQRLGRQALAQQPLSERHAPAAGGRPPSPPGGAQSGCVPHARPEPAAFPTCEGGPPPPPQADVWALVVNVEHRSWLGALARGVGLAAGGRHWLGLKCFDGMWYNLDSHLPSPEPLGDDQALRAFLEHAVQQRAGLVLRVGNATAPGGGSR